MAEASPSRAELEAAHCWEASDHVPRRPATTAFRRAARLRQARWRVANGLPIGSQPMRPRPGRPARPVGSRIDLEHARAAGANFVTDAARTAVAERLAVTEAHQSIDHQGLWADLLSSSALAFNLFADLAADPDRATEALRTWFGDVPGRVREVRFLHSPGRLDPAYLTSLRHFDAAFVLDLAPSRPGIVAVSVGYHERNKAELPRPDNHDRYREVAETSGVFRPGAVDELLRRDDRCVLWLQHLLQLSMLQHADAPWSWGRFATVHPAGNPDLADLHERYRSVLVDPMLAPSITLEALLDADVLPAATTGAIRDRYLGTG
ncbi:MAG: hypothetical protein AAFZ07_21840 [Actinomycetota bacterium]